MKSSIKSSKKLTPGELAGSFVFPRNYTPKQEQALLKDFRTIRKHIDEKETPESKLKSQLLQLRFQIEEYVRSAKPPKEYYFGYFLREYIVRIQRNNRAFAMEIKVNPTELSQIIKRHRKPTEKLIYRLDIHSNKIFPATIWFAVLDKERDTELRQDKTIIESERKNVAKRLHIHL